MHSTEPTIRIGILDQKTSVGGFFHGEFTVNGNVIAHGAFSASCYGTRIVIKDNGGKELASGKEVVCTPTNKATFLLHDVTIGVKFHWERKEDQTFDGALRLRPGLEGTVTAVNEIGVESYLQSVISSEMSSESPVELLRAHAVASRSWLVAMLQREEKNVGVPSRRSRETSDEVVRWYDREDHRDFDVCADDHCQRYQGISKIVSAAARDAVDFTRGVMLVSEGRVCDARFSKACGGITENFENCWEDNVIPYLVSVADSESPLNSVRTEREAEAFIVESPRVFCNTSDVNVLRQVLPSFDQETADFFRWKVEYTSDELSRLVCEKSGYDFGVVRELVPLQRGPSGRIVRLKVVGSLRTMTVGKELEIRRWLSKSHLYSSAFVVKRVRRGQNVAPDFVLHGAGWGHGVGMCQIGAAVMATRGFTHEQILRHYFRGAHLQKQY